MYKNNVHVCIIYIVHTCKIGCGLIIVFVLGVYEMISHLAVYDRFG
jgi:hypothetical protein